MIDKILQEPVVAAFTSHATINVVQLWAIPMPLWAHILVLLITTLAAAPATRSRVTPTTPPSSSG